ncbi:MAG: hypothetical protein ACRDAW_02820 [Metamycoplasmataceae bacterium]
MSNQEKNTNEKLVVDGVPISFESKTQIEGKKFGGTLSYEDIISQTKEIALTVVKTEKEFIEEDSKLRKEKLDALEEQYKNLNAKPLSSIDSYENYNLVLNKSIWNFSEIEQRNTKFTFKDLCLQVHIFIYDGVIVPINIVENTISQFLNKVFEKVIYGNPVILTPNLIVDIIRFDKNKVLPITVANPKLLPPLGVIEWTNVVDLSDKKSSFIIENYLLLLDNALNNGHECEFFPETTMVRGVSGVTSMYISEKAAVAFNKAAINTKVSK